MTTPMQSTTFVQVQPAAITTQFQGLEDSCGLFYPSEYVVVAFADAAEQLRAQRALRAAGWPAAELRSMTGQALIQRHAEALARPGWLRALMASMPSEEQRLRERYLALAAEGANLLLIHAPSATQRQRATQLLAGHTYRLASYFGRWTLSIF